MCKVECPLRHYKMIDCICDSIRIFPWLQTEGRKEGQTDGLC